MTGTKAGFLDEFCAARGLGLTRFDYSGHGASGGRFEDGTIGRWAEEAVAIIDHASDGPLILVGSSMGGWIMLLAALARPDSPRRTGRHRAGAGFHRGADLEPAAG